MNNTILFVIDHQLNPDKYTQEQLKENYRAANANASDAAAADYGAADYAAYAADYAASASYWLNEYFERTGENKQDYIDAIKDK